MENDGRNFEHELKKSKEKERKLKKKYKSEVKEHETFSMENDLILKRCEMLVDKLKARTTEDILMIQNEEHLKPKKIRKELDSDFFWIHVQKK